MKRHIFTLTFVLMVCMVAGQNRADSLAVEKACRNYVEGWATGDASRVERAVSPDLVKRTIGQDREGQSYVNNMSASLLLMVTRMNKDLLNTSQSLSKTGGWEWNNETNNMYWTDETYRIHDLSPGEIEPGPKEHVNMSTICYRPEDRALVLAAFRRCLEEGQPYDLEFPFTTFKGRQLWIRTAAQAVVENGKTKRIIGNIIDITEQKLIEIELVKSKELLANLNK